MERTLIIFKPDSVQRGLCGEILSRFEKKGLQIVGMKLMRIPQSLAETHYEAHKGKPFYAGLVKFMTSSAVVVLALAGKDAIVVSRKLMGATFGSKAEPGTIRGDFGVSNSFNLVHGSDSPEATRDLHNLAGSHEEVGDIETAAALYERALELKDRVVGSDQEELGEMQFSVAQLYIEWGNFSRARELLAMCIGTFKRKKGARLAVAYETAAHIEEYSGRYNDALADLARAAKIWESCGPDRTAELATNMEYRASLLDQMKKKDSANWLRERAAAARAGSI